MSNPSTHVSAVKAVEVALVAISAIQMFPKGGQVAGVYLIAEVMKTQLGLDVNELLNQAQRRYDYADTYYRREAQALTDYVNGELR